jgi:uncharacterized small protein (TIGR04563 family)
MTEAHCEHAFYFDAAVLLDAKKLSQRLDLSLDRLMSLAWELGKTELFTNRRAFSDDADGPVSRPLSVLPEPPNVVFADDIVLPDIAPEILPIVPLCDRRKLSLMFPERALEEIRVLAVHADRSLSSCLTRAYELSRARLFAARRSDH